MFGEISLQISEKLAASMVKLQSFLIQPQYNVLPLLAVSSRHNNFNPGERVSVADQINDETELLLLLHCSGQKAAGSRHDVCTSVGMSLTSIVSLKGHSHARIYPSIHPSIRPSVRTYMHRSVDAWMHRYIDTVHRS